MNFAAGGCEREIPFQYPCQVRASSQRSALTRPSNALGQNEGHWAPAVRTGAAWGHHVDFDFLVVARIKGVSFNHFATDTSETTAKTVLILKGSGPDSYEEVGSFSAGPISFNVTIEASVQNYLNSNPSRVY